MGSGGRPCAAATAGPWPWEARRRRRRRRSGSIATCTHPLEEEEDSIWDLGLEEATSRAVALLLVLKPLLLLLLRCMGLLWQKICPVEYIISFF
jgi:hypothetical protein